MDLKVVPLNTTEQPHNYIVLSVFIPSGFESAHNIKTIWADLIKGFVTIEFVGPISAEVFGITFTHNLTIQAHIPVFKIVLAKIFKESPVIIGLQQMLNLSPLGNGSSLSLSSQKVFQTLASFNASLIRNPSTLFNNSLFNAHTFNSSWSPLLERKVIAKQLYP